MASPPRVVTVVVAFNRRELLLDALAALNRQTAAPTRIIVIDNGSTDGTSAAVTDAFPLVDLVTLDRNTGGAGGFAIGIERAVTVAGADWVWIMDDDTIPDPTALAELVRARSAAPSGTVLLASAVRWTDGRLHPMNTPRVRPSASRLARESAARFGCYPVRSASFVSVLISVDAIRSGGLPIADYFLWNDDFEYTSRLLRRARGYLCSGSTVEHRTRVFGATDVDPGDRFRFEVRNKIWLLTRSDALSAAERMLYAAASLWRWGRTVRLSENRRVLANAFFAGLREGFASIPRPNPVALSGLGHVSEAIADFERHRRAD